MLRPPPTSTPFPYTTLFRSPQRHAESPHAGGDQPRAIQGVEDRKSTRLNSSHRTISYAVFCLKKKKVEGLFVLSLFGPCADDVAQASHIGRAAGLEAPVLAS